MTLDAVLNALRHDAAFMNCVTHWRTIPAQPAHFLPFPEALPDVLKEALRARGIEQLYSHQARAIEAVLAGKHITVVTPTASGKTFCYNLPVLARILQEPDSRALYLFPTKALAADQVAELYSLVSDMGVDIKAYTYDGDTPANARRAIRQAGHVVVTNPDMLHSGVLPMHTKWVKLFENLQYIVIDEVHAYRGVFGSHLANVLRRLLRICAFYGARPQFICCSATIANPKELAELLTGVEMELIDRSGAPTAERHFVFYNPPVVNKPLGLRAGSLGETKKLSGLLVKNDIQTIVFARSRLLVEVLTMHLKRLKPDMLGGSKRVRGYRGGYLPSLRREIEGGLKRGDILCVVSTNALELGIDIGALEACVLCGYPGTIASTWQRAGRAGRRQGTSLTLLIASSNPLDQYVINHPEYFFESPPEHARIDANNLYILLGHIKCAAYELPFQSGERFGELAETESLLNYLVEENTLRKVGERWYWQSEEFPSTDLALRGSPAEENFLIIDRSRPDQHNVIGEMDRFTVPMLLHEQAIYLHEGRQYQVEKLDWEDHKAYIRRVDVGYYTDADLSSSLRVLDVFKEDESGVLHRCAGEVAVTTIVTIFKKLHIRTQENLGFGTVNLPEQTLHTQACWVTFPPELVRGIGKDDLQSGMIGVTHFLEKIAPVFVMCGALDVRTVYHVKDPLTECPTIYLYDAAPGGVGLSEQLYEWLPKMLREAERSIRACGCEAGCPACVGPTGLVGSMGKTMALTILERLREGAEG